MTEMEVSTGAKPPVKVHTADELLMSEWGADPRITKMDRMIWQRITGTAGP